MNYGQLRKRVCLTVGIPTDDSADEEYTLVGDLINEGVRNILSRTRLNVQCLHMHLSAGEQEYEIATLVLRMFSLSYGGRDLEQVARDALTDGTYALPGHNLIALGFPPTQDSEIEAWFTPSPTPMTTDNQDPADPAYGNIEEQFQIALIHYACWRVSDMLDDTSSQLGERYRILYEGQDGNGAVGTHLGQIKRAVNRRAMSGGRIRSHRPAALIDSDPYYWTG